MSDRKWPRINRDLLVYKAFYFFFLSGFGSIFPYLPVYFRQIGLPASQVGLLLGLRPIVQFASAPFWAIMADRYRKRKSVLVMSVISWLIMTMTLAFVEPTNEICEIRQGNDTHQHVVNYTKVKTGFFRRSLWLPLTEADTQTGDATQQQADLDIVPIHIDHRERRLKNISRSNVRVPETSNVAQFHKGDHRSLIFSEGKRSFHPRNNSKLPAPATIGEKQKDKSDISTVTTLTSSGILTVNLNSKNNKQPERFYKKDGPKLQNLTKETPSASGKDVVLSAGEQIKSKHFSRFYKTSNLAVESNRHRNFSERRLQIENAYQQLQGRNNSTKSGLKRTERLRENATRNFTPNVLSPVRTHEKKDNSSTDKRRENKGSPPVVIEFSRIIIPHGSQSTDKTTENSFNAKNEDGSGNFERRPLLEETVVRKTVLHSNEPSTTERVNPNISDILTQISKRPTENIDQGNLLHLEEKLSKMIAFDHPKTSNVSNSLQIGIGEGQKISINDTADKTSSLPSIFLNRSPLVQIHVHNKPFSTKSDKLLKNKLHKSETKFVSHQESIPAMDKTNNLRAQSQVKTSKGGLESDDYGLFSGSANSVLDSSTWYTSTEGEASFYNSQKEEIKRHKTHNIKKVSSEKYDKASKIQPLHNESLLITDEYMSGESPTATTSDDEETRETNFMKETGLVTKLLKKSDKKLQIWMTNLLKTNSFELKRIFTVLLVLVVVGEFLEAPSTTLADASLLEHLGEERRNYGKQRLWGSLGFGLSSFLVGVLLERSRHIVCGDPYTDYMICFCVFALLMLTTLFISTTFKFKYKETDTKQANVFWALCNIHYGSCLAAACFMGVSHGMSHSFLNWFLEDLGATKTLMGVAVICRSSLDLLTFFVAGSLIKAVGQIKIMICALISYGIAFTLYSLLTNPWWVLPIEMLVGCTYAASWSACTSYMAGAASSESVTTIQGIERSLPLAR